MRRSILSLVMLGIENSFSARRQQVYLTEPGNPDALANAILQVIENPQNSREMVELGYERVCSYTLERNIPENGIHLPKQSESQSP